MSHLVDLVVKHTDRAPKRGVSRVSIDGLLIRLIRLVIILLSHEAAAQKVPGLGITFVSLEGISKVLNRLRLVVKLGIALVVEPTKLL